MISGASLDANMKPLAYSFDQGFEDFIDLLKRLEKLRYIDRGWSWGDHHLWRDLEAYKIEQKQVQDYSEPEWLQLKVSIIDANIYLFNEEEVYYKFKYEWGRFGTKLQADFQRAHQTYGYELSHLISVIETILTWKRPQHLQLGHVYYQVHHHPLSRERLGIRWIGWLPFVLNPSDVPEAERVEPLNGGTLIATQSAFWQANPAHPAYSRHAVERAQEVEIRLNALGVLPTLANIQQGNWGQP